jgi:hypothetical protein
MTNPYMYPVVFSDLLPSMATSFLLSLEMAWHVSKFGHIQIMSMKPFLMSSLPPRLNGIPLSWTMSLLMNGNGDRTTLKLLTSFLPLHMMKLVNTVIVLKLISMCIWHVLVVTTLMTIFINVWSTLTQLRLILILLPSMFPKPSIRNCRTATSSTLSLAGWMLTPLSILLRIPLNTHGYQLTPPYVVPSVLLTPS